MNCHLSYKMILLNTILDYIDRCQGLTIMLPFVKYKSERVLKLSNILKLYHRQDYDSKDRSSFMKFINTFELHGNNLALDTNIAQRMD